HHLGSETRATGGRGADVFHVSYYYSDSYAVIEDFTPGEDTLDISNLLDKHILPSYKGGNPFEQGILQIIQQGDDALLQIDIDATETAHSFKTIVRLKGVSAKTITTDDFAPAGMGPVS